jgi:hypothetical protein
MALVVVGQLTFSLAHVLISSTSLSSFVGIVLGREIDGFLNQQI